MEKQQEQVQKCETGSDEPNNAYSLFLYGVITCNKGLLVNGDIISNQQSAVFWYERSPNARIISGLLILILLTVLWAFESHPQSPAATKLKSGICLESFADASTKEDWDSIKMYVVNRNDKVQTILKKALP